jgi:hypothetical protein
MKHPMIAALLLMAAMQPGFDADALRPRNRVTRPAQPGPRAPSRGAVAAASSGPRHLLNIDLSGLSDDDAVAYPASAPALPLPRLESISRPASHLDAGVAGLITSVPLPAAPSIRPVRAGSAAVSSGRATLARAGAPSYPPGRW